MATVASLIFLSPLFLSLQTSLLPFVFSFTSHSFLSTITEKNKIFTLLLMITVQFSSVFKILFYVVLIFQLFSNSYFQSLSPVSFPVLESYLESLLLEFITGTAGAFPYCFYFHSTRHGMALTKADTEMSSQGPMPCSLLLFPNFQRELWFGIFPVSWNKQGSVGFLSVISDIKHQELSEVLFNFYSGLLTC